MDLASLRRDRIQQRRDDAKFAIELQARRHIAVLAVGLTLAGGAGVAGLAGQIAFLPAVAAVLGAASLVLSQLRALGVLGLEWNARAKEAHQAMENLMGFKEETVHDAASDRA